MFRRVLLVIAAALGVLYGASTGGYRNRVFVMGSDVPVVDGSKLERSHPGVTDREFGKFMTHVGLWLRIAGDGRGALVIDGDVSRWISPKVARTLLEAYARDQGRDANGRFMALDEWMNRVI